MRHAVLLLRDHPALAGWQTFEETNLPTALQIATYRKIKSLDPRHLILIVITNEYTPGWYRRTYSDEAQDLLLIDCYPYKQRYDGWPYIHEAMRSLHDEQKKPVPIIPIIQVKLQMTTSEMSWLANIGQMFAVVAYFYWGRYIDLNSPQRAVVISIEGSAPAPGAGSVIIKHERISPAASGRSHCSF